MFATLRARLPHLGRLPRLCAVGICLLLALSSALGAKRAPAQPAHGVPVVVAVRELPAGHAIGRNDVAIARWPVALVPAGARASPTELIGRRLAGPVAAREPVTALRVLGRDLTTGLPAGLVAVPITLDDASAADLLHPGDRVDVLATPRPPDAIDDTSAGSTGSANASVRTVAARALVLAVLPARPDTGAEIVVALPRAGAIAVSRDRAAQMFTVVGDPP